MLVSARIIDIMPENNTCLIVYGSQQKIIPCEPSLKLGDIYLVDSNAPEVFVRKLGEAEQPIKWSQSDAMRWRKPDNNGITRMEVLAKRHKIKRAVRHYLDEQDFLEIDVPLLVNGTTPDLAIESFAVGKKYLVTSTEYQIKRMEIGGFDKTYTLTQNYRQDDLGTYRNPEFTMLEWARVGQTLTDIEIDVENFFLAAHKAVGGDGVILHYQGQDIDITAPWDRLTIRQAVKQVLNIDLPDFNPSSMAQAVHAANIDIRPEWLDDPATLFTLLLDHIQPYLGQKKPVFLHEWPAFLTSSAQSDSLYTMVERSELFFAGVEVSDGFPTLLSAPVQRNNFASHLQRRKVDNKPQVGLDQKYIDAMSEGIPQGAGMALGFDRLVMLLTNQASIATVLAYSWQEL